MSEKYEKERDRMTTIILAEKPNQAEAYAKCFEKNKKENGFYSVKDPMLHDKTIVTYGFGHLVSLAEPKLYKKEWENWDLAVLPIFPEPYQFVVPKDKGKQFSTVKKLLLEATTIIIATDCDREGENIAWSIINKAGANTSSKIFKRLWVNSMEKDVLRKGFANLKEGKDYLPFYEEAKARQKADWLIGMNASPLFSLSLQAKGIQGTYSVGRVQTPTLYMIYSRQLENESFIKEPYWELKAEGKVAGKIVKPTLEPYQSFKQKSDGNTFITTHGLNSPELQGIVEDSQKESKKTESPKLHCLSSMQKVMNSTFKATAKQTLEALQGLYDSKLLSYPRTQCRFITESEFSYLKEHIKEYQSVIKNFSPIKQTEPRKRYVDSKKVTEHYAVIPTKRIASESEWAKLTELQKNIYTEVMRSVVAMFLDNYNYDEQKILIKVNDLLFKLNNKVTTSTGWKEVYKDKDEKNDDFPPLSVGDTFPLSVVLNEKETTPPELYTEATLLTAMITAGKQVDDTDEKKILNDSEGIGTEATRADIIETLKNREYVEIKNNKFHVTPKGKILCKAVECSPLLTSPEMTAKWELYLSKIGKKQGDPRIFVENIQKFIRHLIETVPTELKEIDIETEISQQQEQETIGMCPKCKKDRVKDLPKVCKCENEACGFILFKTMASKKLSQSVIKEVITTGQTKKKITGFKGKKGKFDAFLKLDDTYKLTFDFEKK